MSGCGPAGCWCARPSTRTLRYALKTFWVDPTHQHPIFPEVAVALADIAGFSSGFMWFPRGVRDAETDRFREDAYAVVAQV